MRYLDRTTNVVKAGPVIEPEKRNSLTYRWALAENAIQLLPPTSARRAFKWSYVFARALRRLNPATYL